MFCAKCGNKLDDDAEICPKCGAESHVSVISNYVITDKNYTKCYNQGNANGNNSNRQIQRRSTCNQSTDIVIHGLTIACIAVGAVLLMLIGTTFISENIIKNVFNNETGVYYAEGVNNQLETSQSATFGDTQSSKKPDDSDNNYEAATTVTTQLTTTTTVKKTTASTIAANMKESYLRKKISGKWKADLPYKSMKIPSTFTFDSKGNCECLIKALFITKKFDGSYKVNDGGACSITLIGLEDYVGGSNTMSGIVNFVSDDKLEFKSGDTTWKLKRIK